MIEKVRELLSHWNCIRMLDQIRLSSWVMGIGEWPMNGREGGETFA